MEEAELQKLRETLTELPIHVKPDVVIQRAESIGKSDIPDLPELIQTLLNLSITRLRMDVSLDDFVQGIAESLPVSKDREKRAAFEKTLKSLLSADSLLVSARAFDVQHEYEKVFRTARIISDIRAVFDTAGTAAIGAMIVHNLSVAYFEDGHHKETVFALDEVDVALLKKMARPGNLWVTGGFQSWD
jgi:hypothetical protein